MNEAAGQASPVVTYELSLSSDEAQQGVTRLLVRKNKRLEVRIPSGIADGNTIKLTNAMQVTDGQPGDILIRIKIKAVEETSGGQVPEGVVEVTDASFESEVLGSQLPVVVDFWAPWCNPCKMMSPVVEEAALQYRGRFKFCKINVDENPSAASRYQAMSIPMLLFFKNGQVVDKSVGAIPGSDLRAKLDTLL